MCRWPILLLVVLAGAAAGGAPLPGYGDTATLTDATCNVRHHTDAFPDDVNSLIRGIPRPTERIAPLLDLLAGLDADIFALQEVTPVLIAAL